MKTVTIKMLIPDEAQYIAMDASGDWHWYKGMPTAGEHYWTTDGRSYGLIDKGVIPWRYSLRLVNDRKEVEQ